MEFAYRYEDALGRGPYECGAVHHTYCARRPELAPPTGTHIYGFESLEQAQQWFDWVDCEAMRRHGFRLMRVPICPQSEVRKDGRQIVFRRGIGPANKSEII